ncbi:MAG: autotransporter-associated beta strand repeat-containing protein, partial [Thermoguttaceae bacterium]
MNYERSFVLRILLCLALAGALCSSASAASVFWNVLGPADWNTPTNWNPIIGPVAVDTPIINNDGQAFLATDLISTGYAGVYIGSSSSDDTTNPSGKGTLEIQTGGILNVTPSSGTGSIIIGRETALATGGITGTLNMTGGTITGIANLLIGQSNGGYGSTGSVTMKGNSVINLTGYIQMCADTSTTVASYSTFSMYGTSNLTLSSTFNIGQSVGGGTGSSTADVYLYENSTVNCPYVRVGRQGSVKATLTVTDTAIFTDTGAMAIGAAGNCQGTVYVQKSGTLSATEIDLGTGGSAQGTMYIQGSTIDSTIATVNVSGVVVLGTTGTSKGTIYVQDNGLLSVNGNLNIGTGSSVTSKVYVQGSGALYSKAYIYVGATAGGQGELDISGNAYLNISGGAGGIWIGDYSSGTAQAVGVVNQTGGTVEIYGTGSTNLWQGVLQVGGNQGKGTYNLEAGLFTLYANTNGVSLTWYGSGSVGIFNLDGGTLVTPNVRGGSPYGHGTSTFNFNGGTLMADSSNNAFMSTITHIYVKGGGAIIDDNGAIIGIAQNLESGAVSDGGLTKNGIGTLTLSGNNSYNGATVVNAGTLIVSGSYTAGGGDFTVNSGATLQSGINLNRALIVNGGTVNPGYSPGTLTVTGLKSYDGSAYNFELSNNTKAGGGINDLIAVNGNVTLSGTSTINVSTASYLLGGTYTLITYTGAITGGSANLSMSPLPIITLPVGARPYTGSSFSVIPGAVQLTIQGGPLATNVWMGGKVGSEKLWDTNTTTNWNSSNNLFAVLDCAQFTGNTPGDIDI